VKALHARLGIVTQFKVRVIRVKIVPPETVIKGGMMTRHHCEVWRGNSCISELKGVSFKDPGDALEYVISVVRGLLTSEWATVDWTAWRFEVTDSEGARVLTVPIRIALNAIARKAAMSERVGSARGRSTGSGYARRISSPQHPRIVS
jgi:hypothetical protein